MPAKITGFLKLKLTSLYYRVCNLQACKQLPFKVHQFGLVETVVTRLSASSNLESISSD